LHPGLVELALQAEIAVVGAVGSGKWAVGSGKWEVGSGKWEVGSGQWEVRSEK
jgi:hypothetical protein